MSLLAYNKTTSALPLAAGSPIVTLPASSTAGARGSSVNVTAELQGLSSGNFALLQAQVAAGSVEYEWTGLPEFNTFTLVIGSAPVDVSDVAINLWADPATGVDGFGRGSQTAPLQTFEGMYAALPNSGYKGALRLNLNITATTSAQSTAKKVYTLSNQSLSFLFPTLVGASGETPLIQGGFTNELGDLTATAGSATTLTTNQNLTLDQYKGALLFCISGTGSGNAPRIIRGNTAGPNSVITPEVSFTTPPDATTVYRICFPNVQVQFSQKVLWVAPPQNLIFYGIEFVYTGTGTVDFGGGSMLGQAGAGALQMFGCKFAFANGANKANFRTRGLTRMQLDGTQSYWVGPNNPFSTDFQNTGNYIHSGNQVAVNHGSYMLWGATLIKDFASIQCQSDSTFGLFNGTIENTLLVIGGNANANIAGASTALRARIRLITGTAITFQVVARGCGNNQATLDKIEFSDITGDMILCQTDAKPNIGDVSVAGTNTGLGLKVLTGGKARVVSTSLMSGALGAIQVDTNPVMTLAQALAAPFNGTVQSGVTMPQPYTDPGTGVAVPVPNSWHASVPLTIGAGAETNTLAAPAFVGQVMTITADVVGAGTRAITASAAINQAGNTIMTFAQVRDSITLKGVQVAGVKVWQVISNDGVALS